MNALIIDYESLGYPPDGVIVNVAAIAFDNNPHEPPTFEELVENAFQAKMNIKQQQNDGRIIDKGVVRFWKKQEEKAKIALTPTDHDLSINESLDKLHDYILEHELNPYTTEFFSRGNAFDMLFYEDMVRKCFNTREIYDYTGIKFFEYRDIRTAISYALLTRNLTETPLRMGLLDGFIKHNSIHDCAKDILMLIYAQRYALGLEEPPALEYTIPETLPKKRK